MTVLHYALIFVTIMNVSIIGILEYGMYSRRATRINDVDTSCLGEDASCLWPVVGNKLVRMHVEDSAHYRLDDTPDAIQEWQSLFPGNGMFYLGQEGREFSTSMFHQLRCLDILRASVVEVYKTPNDTVVQVESDLTKHCLNYLRQTMLCNADLHLDPLVGEGRGTLRPREYVCRDWNTAYEELERNQKRNLLAV